LRSSKTLKKLRAGEPVRMSAHISSDEAMEVVAAAAKKHDTAWGCPAFSVEQMKKLHGMGARLLAHGGDFMAMKDMLDESVCHYDEMLEASL